MSAPKGWRRQRVLLWGVAQGEAQGSLLMHGHPDGCALVDCRDPLSAVLVTRSVDSPDKLTVAAMCQRHETEFMERAEGIEEATVMLLSTPRGGE